jgi:hypothetical protein
MSFGYNVRAEIGNLMIRTEEAKHAAIWDLAEQKKQAIEDTRLIHRFLEAVQNTYDKEHEAINMDTDDYPQLIAEMRQRFGEELFPEDVKRWVGKHKVEELKTNLNNRITDLMTEENMKDMQIRHDLEELQQLLKSLEKVGDSEKTHVDKSIYNQKSKGG